MKIFLFYSLQPVKPTALDYNVIMFKQNNRTQLYLSVNLQYMNEIGNWYSNKPYCREKNPVLRTLVDRKSLICSSINFKPIVYYKYFRFREY